MNLSEEKVQALSIHAKSVNIDGATLCYVISLWQISNESHFFCGSIEKHPICTNILTAHPKKKYNPPQTVFDFVFFFLEQQKLWIFTGIFLEVAAIKIFKHYKIDIYSRFTILMKYLWCVFFSLARTGRVPFCSTEKKIYVDFHSLKRVPKLINTSNQKQDSMKFLVETSSCSTKLECIISFCILLIYISFY